MHLCAGRGSELRERGGEMSENRSLRERAEAYLDAHGLSEGAMQPSDPRQLVHELHVYQAELEVQNEELRAAKTAAEVSREYYQQLFQSAPVGYLEIDDRGIVVEVNDTFLGMVGGADRAAVLGRAVALLVADPDRMAIEEYLQSVRRHGRKAACDARLQLEGGGSVWCRVELAPWGREGKRILSAWTDVSSARRDQDRIARLNSLLHAVRQIHRLLVHEPGVQELTESVAHALASVEGYYDAWVGAVGLDGELTASGCSDRGKMSVDEVASGPAHGCLEVAKRYGSQWAEVARNERCPSCRAHSSPDTVAMAIGMAHQGRFLGGMCASMPRRYADDAESRAVFAELAEDMGAALHARRLEQQQAESLQQLEVANSSLRVLEDIVSKSPAIGFRWRLEDGWPVEYVSASIQAFGYDPDQLLSGEVLFADLVHPEDLDRLRHEVGDYLDQGKWEFSQEYRIVTSDGEVRWVDDRTWVLRNASGAPTHAQGVLMDISDRRHAELALAVSEERLRTVFATIPDAVTVTRLADGQYRDVNSSFLSVTRSERSEVLGRTTVELGQWVDPEDRDRLVQLVAERGEVHNFEARFRLPAGERVGLVSARPLDLDGEPHLLAVTRDITELEEARTRLERAQQVEERVAELLRTVLAGSSLDEAANEMLAAACELTASEFGYVGYLDDETGFLVCPTMTCGIWDQCQVSGKSPVFEKFGGMWGWVLDHREPLLCNDPKGEPRSTGTPDGHLPISRFLSAPAMVGERLVGQIALANRELPYTDEHMVLVKRLAAIWAVALDRLSAESSLVESERRYRQLFERMRAGAAVCELVRDEDGEPVDYVHLEINSAFEELTGLSREKVIGRPVRQLLPALGPDLLSVFARVVETGEAGAITFWSEDLGRWYEAVAYRPVPGRFAVLFEDVSSIVEAEHERQRLEAQMLQTQKLESLGVLAGGIAHDFNNLLMGVLGNADLAQMCLPDEGPVNEKIEQIRTAAQRAADLCRQMLAYSGKGRFLVEHVDVNEVIREMGDLLRTSVGRNVTLSYRLAAELPATHADVTQIRQVLMNLITNASEAIEAEIGQVVVTTAVQWCDRACLETALLDESLEEGWYVTIGVSDTGVGMTPETVERIFDPFFTTKFTGRGLGLAAVLGIVRGHKGAIRVASEPGDGTTVTLYFPAVEAVEKQEAQARATTASSRADGRTVLLVDDEASVRQVASSMLEALGYHVVCASDGLEAVEVFRGRTDEIDCVLLDLTMPKLDGEATLLELQKIHPNVRVILSSGYNQQHVVRQFAGRGLAGFIQKPYRIKTLQEALETYDEEL